MPNRSSFIELHISVVLLGATALFGKLLSIHPVAIISGRSLFTVIALAIVMKVLNVRIQITDRKAIFALGLSGFVLALHWLAFFGAIQLSTVAIGVLGFATYPMFVTFLEPFLFRETLRKQDIFSGMIVFIGLLFMVPEWRIENDQTIALLIAVLSGFLLAIFTIINRKFVRKHHFLQITLYQHLAAGLCMFPLTLWLADMPTMNEWGLLILLGVLFTAAPQALLVRCLNQLKAQLVSVSVGLEPVYAILLAIVLLNEVPDLNVLFGGGLILVAVFYASLSHRKSV